MVFQRLIPSLLVKGGRLVKGRQFKQHKDAGAPATTARAHNSQGADELIVCDIIASKAGCEPDLSTLRKIAFECEMPICVGGGIKTVDHATAVMDIGADKIMVNTGAIDNPGLVTKLAHRYGSQAVVIGIDLVRSRDGDLLVYDHRVDQPVGRLTFVSWAKELESRGGGEIRIMSVEREGTLCGYDHSIFEIIRPQVSVPIVIEGGGGTLDHIENMFALGADGICVGSMLVFSDANLVKIKQRMKTRRMNIRSSL